MGKRGKSKTVKIVAGLASIAVLASLVGIALRSPVLIADTPETIVPTNIAANPITMDVYTQDGGTLLRGGIASDSSGKANYADPDSRYSPVQAMCSDTWLSDVFSVPIEDGYAPSFQESNALPVYDGEHVFTIQKVYHYVVWMSVESVIRTGPANSFAYTPSTTYVSPYEGYWISGIKPPVSLAWHAATGETQGALTMWQHRSGNFLNPVEFQTNTMDALVYGNNVWRSGDVGGMSTHGPYAAITTSLIPHSTWQQYLVDRYYPVLQTNGWADDVWALQHMASAEPVKVEVTMRVDANSEQIRAYGNDFQYSLSDGTVVNVKVGTVSAVVGFSGYPDGLRSTGTYTGLVPNTNPLHNVPNFGLADPTMDGGAASAAADLRSTSTSTPTQGGTPITIYGDITPLYSTPQQLYAPKMEIGTPRGSIPYTTNEPGGPGSVLNLEDIEHNCGLPQQLTITTSNTMGPELTAYNTIAYLRYQDAYEQNDAWKYDSVETYMQWCYGLQDDNVMIAQNFTFPVDIVSERAVQLFASDGSPIDLMTIVDTDINSIFNDPRLDEIHVKQTTPDLTRQCEFDILDIPGYVNCLIKKYSAWIVGGLILIVALAGLYIFANIRKAFK